MRAAARGCGLVRGRPALEILPRWRPRGSGLCLWGKCAARCGDGRVRASAGGDRTAWAACRVGLGRCFFGGAEQMTMHFRADRGSGQAGGDPACDQAPGHFFRQ